jgi:hypothetical protein
LKLTSISKIDVSQEHAKLPKQKDGAKLDYSNMTLEIIFLDYHPYKNRSASQHSFPWDDILSLFNGQDMTDPKALKHMLAELSLGFIYDDHEDRETNLITRIEKPT